jgi:hypothetical protein
MNIDNRDLARACITQDGIPVAILTKPGIGTLYMLSEACSTAGYDFIDMRAVGCVTRDDLVVDLCGMLVYENTMNVLVFDDLHATTEEVRNAIIELATERCIRRHGDLAYGLPDNVRVVVVHHGHQGTLGDRFMYVEFKAPEQVIEG